MSTEKFVDALTDMVKEAAENTIAEKIQEEIGDIDWSEVVNDRVDFEDLVKETVNFDELACDAVNCCVEDAVNEHVRHMDWSEMIQENVELSEVVRNNVELSEIVTQVLTDGFNERWEENKKILETYIENRLDQALRDKVEAVVEERLTGSFHDIDRDLQERVNPLLGEIEILKLEIAKLKDRKPWYLKILGR